VLPLIPRERESKQLDKAWVPAFAGTSEMRVPSPLLRQLEADDDHDEPDEL
jgi:hypothetical protein